MKTKIFLGCIMAASLITVSCSDLLQENPQGKLTPEGYFSTQEELDMSVYSLYSKVNYSQTRTNPQYPQWQGDDITTNPGSNKQVAAEIDRFAPVNSNKGVKDCWSDHYAIIKAANFIIQNASKTPTDAASLNQAIGQAKFWRAYAYFTLVRLFGDDKLKEKFPSKSVIAPFSVPFSTTFTPINGSPFTSTTVPVNSVTY